METNKRQRILLIIVIAGVALFLGDSVIFEPLLAHWKAGQKEIADKRAEVGRDKLLIQSEVSLRSNWDSKRTNALPSDQSMAEALVFKAFDHWERASGISRVSLKPQWRQGDDDSYATLECRADYNGDLDQVKRFLYEMEQDPMGLKLENVEISSRDDNGQQLSLGVQVSGLQLNPAPEAQQP